MVDPQHHPIAHQGDDGEGKDQQPHHQHEGDGGAAGKNDGNGKRISWMGQQLQQPPTRVGVDGDVEMKLKANPAQPDARYNIEEVPSINKIRKMFQDLTQRPKGCIKPGTKYIKPITFKTQPKHDNPPTMTKPNRTPEMMSKEEFKLDRKTNNTYSKEEQPPYSKEDMNTDRKTQSNYVIDRKTTNTGTAGVQIYSVSTQPKLKPVIDKTLSNDRKTSPPFSMEEQVTYSEEDKCIDRKTEYNSMIIDNSKGITTQLKLKLTPILATIDEDRKTELPFTKEEYNDRKMSDNTTTNYVGNNRKTSDNVKCNKEKKSYIDRKTLDYYVNYKGKTNSNREEKFENKMQQQQDKLQQNPKLKNTTKSKTTKDQSPHPTQY